MSSVPVDASDWTWVLDDDAPLGVCGCLTFVRRASERQVLAGFAMDADTARLMTADEVRLDPVLSSASYPEPGPFWVRVARVGDWAVGIEWMQTKGDAENVAKGLSIGTEAIAVSVPGELGFGVFRYYDDGVWTTHFCFGEGYDTRGGTDPDRFRDALAAVGLGGMESGTLQPAPKLREATLGTLTMLTNTFGIRLPYDVYAGPLLTASRTARYFYQPPKQPDSVS